MLVAAVAMLASCSQDLTSDLDVNVNGTENAGSWSGEGILVEATAQDVTRVNTNVDNGVSYLTWEAGDELILVHNGAAYTYVAQSAGRTSTFAPKDDANALTAVDATLPVAAYYNIAEVDAATLKATFNVAPEQVEGEKTNKLPLYAYASTTVVEGGKVVVTMKPLASVVEFELHASSAWNADAFSLGRASRQRYTFPSANGIVVDPATGVISYDSAKAYETINVKLASLHNFATKRNIEVIVVGASLPKAVTSGEGDAAVTTTIHYKPIYHGKACVKLYKNGVENFRRTIWNSYTPNNDAALTETKHIYQPLKDILDGHKNGISTAEDFKAFADEVNYSVETFPCGTGFCNEDGVVLLNNDINISQYTDWLAIGNNYSGTLDGVETMFAGHFDGQNHTIEGLKAINNAADQVEYVGYDGTTKSCPWIACGLFGALWGGSIKNLTVKGDITADYYTDVDAATWCYAGGLLAHHFGGVVDNCNSYVNISVGENTNGKLRLGGVVGRLAANACDAVFTNCKYYGNMNLEFKNASVASQIGGVLGCVGDISAGDEFTFNNCENHGTITIKDFFKTSRMGGVLGYSFYLEGSKPAEFEGLKNAGNITISSSLTTATAVYFGGVVANLEYHSLKNCHNSGNLEFTSLDAVATVAMGGIVGRANASNTDTDVCLTNCINTGNVTMGAGVKANKGWLGGVAGCTHAPCFVDGCHNFGNVSCNTTYDASAQMFIGGVSGLAGWESNGLSNAYVLENSNNYGVVTVGPGAVKGGWRFTGGIAGMCYGGKVTDGTGAFISDCNNYGSVRTISGEANIIGGIIGAAWLNPTVSYCSNFGTVASERKLYPSAGQTWEGHGGIVGYIYTGETTTTIKYCHNEGVVACRKRTSRDLGETPDINVYVVMGGIQGSHGCAGVTILGCESRGKVWGPHDALHTWNASTEVWDVSQKHNFVYRGALVAHPNKALICTNNKVGGYIGVVADQDPTSAKAKVTVGGVEYTYDKLTYTASADHKLVDDPESDWYWKKWRHGYTATPATSKATTTFLNE